MDYCTKSNMESNLCSSNQADSLSNLHMIRNLDADMLRKLIQTYTPEELLYRLKSQYLISSTQLYGSKNRQHRPIVIAYLNNEDSLHQSLRHLAMLSQEIQVCVCVTAESIYNMIQHDHFLDQKGKLELIFLEKNDVSLLDQYADAFEYICLLHDASGKLSDLSGRQLQTEYYVIWDNLIKNSVYMWNVVDLFSKNPHLGLLLPPSSLHGNLLGNYRYRFQARKTSTYANKFLQLVCDSETCFWCKAEIFKEIVSTKRGQNQSYPDIAKNFWYATAIIMNYEYAALQLEKLNIILRKLLLRDMEETYCLY